MVKFRVTGDISEENLPTYFHACDLFCVSSAAQTDAIGIVQIKAMACGKPFVGPVKNNGINVDSQIGLALLARDAGSLAAAINLLIRDSLLRKRMGLQSVQSAIS